MRGTGKLSSLYKRHIVCIETTKIISSTEAERKQAEEEDNCKGKCLMILSRYKVKNNVKVKKMCQQDNIY